MSLGAQLARDRREQAEFDERCGPPHSIQTGVRSMKHLSSTSWLLSVLILLGGCGGGGGRTSGPAPASSPLPPADPPPHVLDIAGNWQFSTTSVAGMAPATISGGIAQSGSSVSGAAHLDGSKCFDRLTTIGLTGTLTGSN